MLTALTLLSLSDIPTPSAPTCSISSTASSSMPNSKVLSFKAGGYERCLSLLLPDTKSDDTTKQMPILFVAHGSGGNARNFPAMPDQASGDTWADVALKYGFAVAGVEALQFSSGPPGPPGPGPSPSPPGPVPSECIQCFKDAGCKKGAFCDSCCKDKQKACASKCMPTPFPEAEAAVCGASNSTTTGMFAYEYTETWTGPDADGSWHGGQWIIPEVQNDTTGIVCDFAGNPDLAYLTGAVSAMSKLDELDTSRLFFTGCSMGSALTVWAAQCFHKSTPSAVTAFGTQSTGLKVKGDGLSFPPDNYDPGYKWGECPTCKYFPAPVVKTSGLKACINDQTGDQNFYESSEALDSAWKAAGMKSDARYYSGGHCQTHSFEDIATCMDDGTGRLIGSSAVASQVVEAA